MMTCRELAEILLRTPDLTVMLKDSRHSFLFSVDSSEQPVITGKNLGGGVTSQVLDTEDTRNLMVSLIGMLGMTDQEIIDQYTDHGGPEDLEDARRDHKNDIEYYKKLIHDSDKSVKMVVIKGAI